MPLLRPYRRWWSLWILMVLCIPLLLQVAFGQASSRVSTDERRALSRLPAPPTGIATLKRYPRELDKYLDDHFGGRSDLLDLNNRLRFALRSPTTTRAAYGKDDWLFYTDEQVMQQATGEQMRGDAIAYLAGLTAEMQSLLNADSNEFYAALMPNTQSIHREHLPDWARPAPASTEYDLFLAEMRRVGVTSVDLRVPLRAAARQTSVYRKTDSHWNNYGALLAFNTLVAATSRAEWAIAPEVALGARQPVPAGDLARMLGISSLVTDDDFGWKLPDLRDRNHEWGRNSQGSYEMTGLGNGGTVLVLGDSFSRGFLRPLLGRSASRLVWMDHRNCRFDWAELERFDPDVVYFLMVERAAASCLGNRPQHMPAPGSAQVRALRRETQPFTGLR
jgi:hypothetical protein